MKLLSQKNIIFWVVWVVILLYLGTFSVLTKRPQSMHQWAQCDRASVARNYAEESMNFFLPRVHESKMFTGITGMEFPLMNYAAAICYKVFGFNEFWYRLLMLITVSLGVFYGVKMAGYFLPSYFYALLVPLIWYLSPILVFYTPNFLPDAAGLAFCMIAWWGFFSYQRQQRSKYFWVFLVMMSLASLVKISYLMAAGVIIGVFVLDYLHFFNWAERKQHIKGKPKFLLATAISVVLTFVWYRYSAWVSAEYHATYFLLEINPERTLQDLFDRAFNSFHFWANSFYYGGVLLFITLGILFITYFYQKVNRLLLAFTLLYFLGNLCFYVVMAKQFQHHDYYFISTYPFAFFLFLMIADVVYKVTREQLVYLRMALPLIILFMAIGGMDYSLGRQHMRYDKNGSYNYAVFDVEKFDGMEEYVRELGLTKQDDVVVAFDPSPNIFLYFLNLKGYSFSEGHSQEVVFQRINEYRPDYLVSSDDRFLQYHFKLYEVLTPEFLGEKNEIKVYKLNYIE